MYSTARYFLPSSGHHLAEDRIAALLEEFFAEAEEVVDIQQPEGTEREGKVFVEFIPEAFRLDLKLRILFHIDAVCFHIFV